MQNNLEKLEQEKEEIDNELKELYINQNNLEEELRAIKNNISNYRELIVEIKNIKNKLPKSLKRGILISLIPILMGIVIGGLGQFIFSSVTASTFPIIYFTILTSLMFTPAAVLIGTKEYFEFKNMVKENNEETLQLIIKSEEESIKIVEDEYRVNKSQIKKYEDEKIILKLCIEEILNPNLKKEEIIEVFEQLGKQKIKK